MGRVEKAVKEKRRKAFLQQAVLTQARDTVLFLATAFGPDAYVKFRIGSFDRVKTRYDKYRIKKSFYRLVDSGMLELVSTPRGKRARLTRKGEQYLRKIEAVDFVLPKPKKWDEKYRVVIFDIKEGKRRVRGQLRATLRTIGFIQLQKSVWVYPYDCEDLITILKADFKIGREVLYMVVDQIEGDEWVRKHFGLAVS